MCAVFGLPWVWKKKRLTFKELTNRDFHKDLPVSSFILCSLKCSWWVQVLKGEKEVRQGKAWWRVSRQVRIHMSLKAEVYCKLEISRLVLVQEKTVREFSAKGYKCFYCVCKLWLIWLRNIFPFALSLPNQLLISIWRPTHRRPWIMSVQLTAAGYRTRERPLDSAAI